MEPLLSLLGIAALGIPVGAVLGIIAFTRTRALRSEVELLSQQLAVLVRNQARVRSVEPPPQPDIPPPAAAAVVEPVAAADEMPPAIVAASRVPLAPAAPPAPLPPAAAEISGAVVVPPAPSITVRVPQEDFADAAEVESLLGRNLLAWAGVGLLFLGLVFFAKYAYDQSWFGQLIGPRTRVALVAGAGLALAAWGWHCLRQGMVALGQSAVGGGLAILQVAVYAALMPGLGMVPVALIDHGTAFALLVAITAAGVLSARRLDAPAVSLIALVGGLLAPVLLSTGGNSRDLLFGWLLVLDLGVLAVAVEKRWRALDMVAAVGTGLLAWGWLERHYSPDQLLPTLLWFSAFHVLFLALPLLFHVRTRTPVTVERVALLLANLAWYLGIVGALHHDAAPRFMGVVSAVLAPLYLLVGLGLRRRIPDDRLIMPACVALAIALLTMALGNLLPVDGVAAAWAVESAVLLQLGHQCRHGLTRLAALVVAGLVVLRVLLHVPGIAPETMPFLDLRYLQLSLATLALAAQAFLHRWHAPEATETDRLCGRGCALAALAWFMVCGQLELYQHLTEPLLPSALWWLAGGGAVVAAGRILGGWSARAMPWCAGICGLIAGSLALAGFVDEPSLSGWPVANLRWLAAGGAVVLLYATRIPGLRPLAWVIAFLGWSAEGPSWCHQLIADPTEAARAGSFTLTAAWMLAAGLLLTAGLLRQRRPLRVMALLLCALVAGKLLLFDLAQAGQLWRILAFILVGVLFLAGSWAYHRLLKGASAQPRSNLPSASGS